MVLYFQVSHGSIPYEDNDVLQQKGKTFTTFHGGMEALSESWLASNRVCHLSFIYTIEASLNASETVSNRVQFIP